MSRHQWICCWWLAVRFSASSKILAKKRLKFNLISNFVSNSIAFSSEDDNNSDEMSNCAQ